MKREINIYGTIGPACDSEDMLCRMLAEGMTGVRVNLSHVSLEEAKASIERIHRAFQRAGRRVDILMDMQGPEMRIGVLSAPLALSEGDIVRFISEKTGCSAGEARRPEVSGAGRQPAEPQIPLQPRILEKLSPGQQIKLDDGRLLLEILSENGGGAKAGFSAGVLRGGVLSSRKSIAIQGKESDLPALTARDIENIDLAGSMGITGLMQPFVRGAEDIRMVRQTVRAHRAEHIRIYAKIENRRGVERLSEIIPEADEIIIARGDLGNAMPLWELPACQKHIAGECRRAGKPFMVVTQMLASMEHSPVPTRAEVSDVYNAVADGASSVMVTGETAVGEYPAEVIRYLSQTSRAALHI